MEPTDASVDEFIESVTSPRRRRDARTLVALMRRLTGEEPRMWGPSIIGFGEYRYRYDSGREGRAGAMGFAPRTASTTIYLPDGTGAHEERLARLGPHTASLVCVYIKDLEKVDLDVLEEVLLASYRNVTDGVFTKRARDSKVSSASG